MRDDARREGGDRAIIRLAVADRPSMPRLERALVLVAALAVVLLLSTASLRKIWEADFWWQYATGELVATQGIPHADGWSYVSRGRPWTEMRWLYCTLLYRAGEAVGFSGLVILKALAVLATFGFAGAAARVWRAPATAAVVLVAAILASTQRFYVRPELASFLLMAAYMWVISRFRAGGSRVLWVLPPLQVLWSNLHTQFLLGPALVGLLLVVEMGERLVRLRMRGVEQPGGRRRLATIAGVVAATSAACLLTPYGFKGILFGLGLLREMHDPVFREVSAELRGTFSFGTGYAAVAWFRILLGIAGLSVLGNLRRLDPYWTSLAVSQLYLALTSIRNLPLFCLAAIPLVVDNAMRSDVWGLRGVRALVPAARVATLTAAVLASLAFARGFVTDRFNVDQSDTNQFGVGLAAHRFPEGAARYLRDHPVPGALFNTMFEGSYLIAQGFDVFIDPRLEVHGAEFLARYSRMTRDPVAWREAESRHDFKAAVVDLGSPVLDRLAEAPGWQLAHFDEVAAVFVRGSTTERPALRSPGDFSAAAAAIRASLPPPPAYVGAGYFGRVVSPAPYQRVADFLVRVGQGPLAEPFARDALRAFPLTRAAHLVLGRILEERGEAAEALREYEAELSISPSNGFARRQAGILSFQVGRPQIALALLSRSVDEVPSDARAWAVLTKIHADAGRPREALRCAERAAALDPLHAAYAANLGRLQAIAGALDPAIAALAEAVRLDPSDASVHRDLAVILFKSGRRADAQAAIERALALAPNDAELLKIWESLSAAGTAVGP